MKRLGMLVTLALVLATMPAGAPWTGSPAPAPASVAAVATCGSMSLGEQLATPDCRRGGPEALQEVAQRDGQRGSIAAAPLGSIPAGALARASMQVQRIAAANSHAVPNSQGSWFPVGTGPLLQNDPTYTRIFGLGDTKVTGRVTSFAYDPGVTGLWFAASSDGGVWMTVNSGSSWVSIGDNLPTQTVGAIAWTPAGGGTLLAGTGDNAFCFNCVAGLGIYTSNDYGASWHQSTGLPGGPRSAALDGPLTFKIAVDPSNATGNVLYAATSKGLFKSTDAGASFVDVMLPTSPASYTPNCQGQGSAANPDPHCFFANIVTDVVVRGADGPAGSPAGSVMAAVGWRAGQKLFRDASGTVTVFKQAPQNGIYVSTGGGGGPPGDPNTFHYVAPLLAGGFTQTNNTGRTALGIARGPGQNHDVVYALVQSSGALNSCTGSEGLDAVGQFCGAPVAPSFPDGTILDGLYMTTNFAGGASPGGAIWVKVVTASALTLQIPANNSSMGPGSGLQSPYHPGIQSWYNLWVEPDPTQNDILNNPSRVVFGLEEVWEYSPALSTDAQVPNPRVIGRYWNSCEGLTATQGFTCNSTTAVTGATTTTHPDQHAGTFVPDGKGGVTLLAGNDGGAYKQHVDSSHDFSNDTGADGKPAWGDGIQEGMHTLQTYDLDISKDGTIVAGLQDNGELKINPDGSQYNTHDGDGFFTGIDPDNSKNILEEYARGTPSVTNDGGATWRTFSTPLTGALFSTPIQRDPQDATHYVIGAREIKESGGGIYGGGGSWAGVFNLGTRSQPGQAAAVSSATDSNNVASALDVNGANVYAGFCSNCDINVGVPPFFNGIATNVGGDAPPKQRAGDGWHIAAANCGDAGCPGGKIPNRYITSIRMDPGDPNTVYVTLGGYQRPWVVPGAIGDDPARIGAGHVFKSTDHGENFHDISGNLPDAITNWTAIYNGQLIVADNFSVYISSDANGSDYVELGGGLPRAHVQSMRFSPSDPNLMVVSNYGRGVYGIRLAPSAVVTPPSTPLPNTVAAAVPAAPAAAVVLALGVGFGLAAVLARRRRRLHRTA